MSPDFHVICLRSQDYGIHNTLYLSNFLCHLTLCMLFLKILYLSRVIILFFLFIIEVLYCSSFVGAGQVSKEKLEFKHRLSIGLGAAKGDPLQNQ